MGRRNNLKLAWNLCKPLTGKLLPPGATGYHTCPNVPFSGTVRQASPKKTVKVMGYPHILALFGGELDFGSLLKAFWYYGRISWLPGLQMRIILTTGNWLHREPSWTADSLKIYRTNQGGNGWFPNISSIFIVKKNYSYVRMND